MALTSPDGRFRFVKDASGCAEATAYDTENGLLVNWNVLEFRGMTSDERLAARTSVDLLKGLSHSHVLRVHSSWEAPSGVPERQWCPLPWQGASDGGADWPEHCESKLVYVTTPCTTLEAFVRTKVEFLRWRVVKRWCRQVLEALSFLHSQPTPIVHKELCLGNVYIDPSTSHLFVGGVEDIVALCASTPPSCGTTSSESEAKMGYNSTAEGSRRSRAWARVSSGGARVCEGTGGTVEEEGKSAEMPIAEESVGLRDIQAFGYLFIEMILKKRLRPSLARDEDWIETLLAVSGWPACVVDFIGACRAPVEERPSAAQLLEHPFLELGNGLDDEPVHSDVERTATEAFAAAKSGGMEMSAAAGDLPVMTGMSCFTSGRSSPPPPVLAPLNSLYMSKTRARGVTSLHNRPVLGSSSVCLSLNHNGCRDGDAMQREGSNDEDRFCPRCRGLTGWSGCLCSPRYTPSCVSTESPSPSSPSAMLSFDTVISSPPRPSRLRGNQVGWAHNNMLSLRGGESFSGEYCDERVFDDEDCLVEDSRLAHLGRIRAASCSAHDARSSIETDPRTLTEDGDSVDGVESTEGTRPRSASEDAVWDMLPSDERECRRPFTCSVVDRRY